jgi:hypothetical protein
MSVSTCPCLLPVLCQVLGVCVCVCSWYYVYVSVCRLVLLCLRVCVGCIWLCICVFVGGTMSKCLCCVGGIDVT